MPGSDKVHDLRAWAALVFPTATARPTGIRWANPFGVRLRSGNRTPAAVVPKIGELGDLGADIAGIAVGGLLGVLTHYRVTGKHRAF